jgi:ATP-dependent Clp protease ATP-binding subunit ClpA
MINQMIEDLKTEFREALDHPLYGKRKVSLDTFLHHTLSNHACQQLMRKYGVADVDGLQNAILDMIINQTGETNADGTPFSDGNNNPQVQAVGQIRTRTQPLVSITTSSFETVKLGAIQLELDTLQNPDGTRLNAEDAHDVDPKYESYIKSLYNWSQQEGQTHLILLMQEHKFSWEKFLNGINEESEESIMDELCLDLNKEAEAGRIDEVIGRDKEVLFVAQALGKRRKNNVVLLGKAGVGKTAIADGLALKIVKGEVPHTIQNARVYSLQTANMVAGTQFRGQFEEKLMQLIEEFKRIERETDIVPILFIDEIHTIVGSGGSTGGNDFANIIKPALSKGELRCIGATTDEEWSKFIKTDRALRRRFSEIDVKEPTREECIAILRGAKTHYEKKHLLEYTDDSLVRAVDLSIKFITNSALPDKALDLMDWAGSINRIEKLEEVSQENVEETLSQLKGIPLKKIQEVKEDEEVKPLQPELLKTVFGQDDAVEQVVKVVERNQAGLGQENKPMGSFLFVGPTGVGKTELAKQLADTIGASLVRIDMSEYMEKHALSSLIGAPAGYVGYGEEPILSKAILKNPYCVLLLDEMEKAHPDISDLFLQAMDNGKITDRQGEVLNFENTIIIMTSNAGARERQTSSMGFVTSVGNVDTNAEAKAQKEITNRFKPEFLGRLNAIVKFNKLSEVFMVKIAHKHVKNLNVRLLKKNIEVVLSDEAADWIVKTGNQPELGARPIENTVRREVEDQLTEDLLRGELKKGNKKVTITVDSDKLKFNYSDKE